LQLRPTESTLLLSKLRTGDFDIYLRSMSRSPFSYDFSPLLYSGSIGVSNFTRFASSTSDKLIKNIILEENLDRKAQLLRRFQVLLRQESPLVVLFFSRYRIAAAKSLTNLRVSGLRPGYDVMAVEPRVEPEG
jgi:ABC-type oligopeptide transport system substrate-binding subunit